MNNKTEVGANLTDVCGQLVLGGADLFAQGTVVGRLLLFRFLKQG